MEGVLGMISHFEPPLNTLMGDGAELIEQGLDALEMVYIFHEQLVDHNEIMGRAMDRINKGIDLLKGGQ